jgi:NADPH:quinone reductase-like Zn-dependent oxidoreductase
MRAYVIDGFGETGSVREMPDPAAAEGQVLVRIRAAGVNPFDNTVVSGAMKDRMEHRFPFIPGLDGAGVVEAIGDGVEGYAEGDEVFGAAGKPYFGEGTFAERTAMSVGTIARKPSSIDFTQAASIPTAGIAALTVFDAVDVRAGETLLAIGASGGVGSFLVQVAAGHGVRVIGVARPANADYVRGLGASEVVDASSGDLAEALRSASPDGIDAIADMSGDKELVTRLSEQLRSGGRVASTAGGADEEVLAPRGVKSENIFGRLDAERLGQIAQAIEEGRIRTPEVATLPLDRAGDAITRVAERHTRGKLVLTVG